MPESQKTASACSPTPETGMSDACSTSSMPYVSVLPPRPPQAVMVQVPWPGYTYHIVRHGTSEAITKAGGNVLVKPLTPDEKNQWVCVENKGYFGFYEKDSGRYLGHNGKRKIWAAVCEPNDWECVMPRLHPSGSFQLLLPHFSDLELLSIGEDKESLEMRKKGHELWDFVEV